MNMARPGSVLLFLVMVLANLAAGNTCEKPLLAEAYWYKDPPLDYWLLPDLIRQTGGPMVDLGSGSGRALKMAYDLKVEAVGIDSDPYMAEFTRKKLPGVSVMVGDYTRIALPEKVGLYASVSNTWSMVTRQRDRQRALRHIYRSLRPDGRLFISMETDVATGNITLKEALPEPGAPISFQLDCFEFPRRAMRRYDLTLSQRNLRERYSFPSRMISQKEMKEDFEAAHFKILESYGGKASGETLEPLTADSELQIYILGK